MRPTFRPAQPSDLPVLLDLMAAYYTYDGLRLDRNRAETALTLLLKKPAYGQAWLIEVDGAVAGYVVLALGFSLEYGGRDAFLDELYLHEPYRGQGLGRQTLAFVEEQARALGVQALHLEVERANTRAHAAYRRWGFIDQDRFLMTRRLDG